MADNTLDSLNIQIRASASQAVTELNSLSAALSGLDTNLAPVAIGLEKVTQQLRNIIGYSGGVAALADSFKSLSSSWTGLMNTTKKSGNSMGEAATKAKTMGDAIAKEFGIKGKENIQALTTAIESMYNSIGDNVAIGRALNNVEKLIRQYSTFKATTDENALAMRAFLREHNIQLDEAIKKRKDLWEVMGKLGTKNISESGMLPSEFVKEYNFHRSGELYDPDKDYSKGMIDISGMTDESAILDKIIEHLKGATQETLNFAQVTNQSDAYMEQFGDVLGRLNNTIDNLAATAGTTTNAAFDAFTDAFVKIHAVAPGMADSLMRIDSSMDNLTDTAEVNPFAGVIAGLEGLQGINLSDSLANLDHIRDAVGKLGGKYSSAAADNLINMANALRQWEGVQIPNYGGLAYLAAALGEFGKAKLTNGFDNLIRLKTALVDFGTIHIDPSLTTGVQQLADALYKFGLAKMEKASANLPALSNGIKSLITSLSSMPQVSENTIRLVTALGNLNISGGQLNKAMSGVNTGLKSYRGHAINARKASMSLASAFGKMYANFFIFFRLAQRFKKDIDLASSLKEVQNVVDVTFGAASEKMNDFAKTSIETLGMSELTAKQIGSKYQAMGKAMGISSDMAKSTNDFVQKATDGYADVAEGMADISINLTKLAGDMASFYNEDYEQVAERLQAVFTGQTRPLRAYGIDLTQATLKEWALKNGMDANIKTMTQAEKTLLRYKYVMAQTTAAQGDFIRTQDTWANQTRIAAQKLEQLRIILGKIAIYTFKPLVKSFNEAMTQILKGAEGLLNALGKIFGWKIEWSDAGVLQDESDDAEDLADSMGDAADNAKKFKNFLLGIDELNLLPDDKDTSKGSGSGAGGIGGIGDDLGNIKIEPVEKGFESLYDTLYKLGKRIAEVEKELLKGIDWDKIYKNARKFGKGFASFLNGYLSDVELFYYKGRTLANGINTIAHAIDAFFKEFDGRQFGIDRAMELNGFTSNLDWGTIKSAAYEMAHDISEYINGYIENVNWRDVGKTLIEGVNTAVLFASTIVNEVDWAKMGNALGEAVNGLFSNWDEEEMARMFKGAIQGALDLANNFLTKTDFELLGHKIGNFLAELDLSQFAAPLADLILNLFKAAFNLLGTMALEAPLETALLTAFAGAKFLKLGGLLSTSITTALKSSLATEVGTVATDKAVASAAADAGVSIGTAIAASVVTAFAGYEFGKKIGKEFFETDDMWYDSRQTNVGKELITNLGAVPAALSEMVSFMTTDFTAADEAYKSFGSSIRDEAKAILGDLDQTWGDIRNNLRMGDLEISDADFVKLQAMLKESGAAMSQITPLINSLKSAQDEYTDDLAKYIEEESKAGVSREEAYNQYKRVHSVVDEYVKSHERERLALQSGASTYQEVYDRITNITHSSSKKVMDNISSMSNALTQHDRNLDGSKKTWNEFEKSATGGGNALKTPLKAMVDLKDKSSLAISGVADLTGKLNDMSKSEEGVKNMSTDFTKLSTSVTSLNTALAPVKAGFNEFTLQMQMNMANVANTFGQSFNSIMKSGNQTIAWLKSSFVPYFSAPYWNSLTQSIPNAFGNAFKQAITIMQNLWGKFATWANDNMKMNIKANGKKEADIQVEVPKYSTGGFPEDGFFWANHSEMVGQFSNGRTAVANNEQIIEGIRQGVYEAVSSAMGNGGNVNVTLNGDAARFFTAMVEENENAIRRTGASPIRV